MSTRNDRFEWLDLVDTDGPFLSKAALKSFHPQGLARPDATVDDVHERFVDAHARWYRAWARHSARRDADGQATNLDWRDAWIETVLRELAGWESDLVIGPSTVYPAASPDGRIKVEPWGVLEVDNSTAAIVVVTEPTDDLRTPGSDGWAANAVDRAAALLRGSDVTIAVVTDGRWWGLVSAVKGENTGSGVWDAAVWREERPYRDALFSLVGFKSLAGGSPQRRLPALFAESIASAYEVTEELGRKVRRAVELLVQAMSEAHLNALAEGKKSPLPDDGHVVYDGAVTSMIRVIFLLFAEERGLLPQQQLYRDAYGVSHLMDRLDERVRSGASGDAEEVLDYSYEAWHRLLAASTAVFHGATFDDVRMPAYGGSLFDPDRFPWFIAEADGGELRLKISDRVMLHVFRAVQRVQVRGESRRISFRDLDVEQIGYVYEGLLGYSAEYVDHVVVGMEGKEGLEPEVTLNELMRIRESASEDDTAFVENLLSHLKTTQEHAKPRTVNQLVKALAAGEVDEVRAHARRKLGYVARSRAALVDELIPFHAIIRGDLRGLPYVVPPGGLVMVETSQRANTGTHYTPRALAEEVVRHTLEPLVYEPGPLQTSNSDDWKPKDAAAILNLKVADIAAGSGAFLVAAARYLADRLVEAKTRADAIPDDAREDLRRWALREVIARCLYGADINAMAVEMCKLSLWLVSMDPMKPFSFVDDRIFYGNSLLGLTEERQLRGLHIDPSPERLRNPGFGLDVADDLKKAARLRREITNGQVDDADPMRSTRMKQQMLAESREVTARLRDVADGVVAAGLKVGGKPGKALEAQYEYLSLALLDVFGSLGGDRSSLDRILLDGLTPTTLDGTAARWKPLHWIIEAPDILVDRSGFDAIIGNPPFLGGKKLRSAIGENIRDWLVNQIAEGERGNADLVAYFFLRVNRLLRSTGQLGLIATNTVAQGDTREVGLDRLVGSGLVIRRSVQSRSWPARSANIEFAAVWGSKAPLAEGVLRVADDVPVARISPLLEPEGRFSGNPVRLNENKKVAFIGSFVLGKGFVLEPATAQEILNADERNILVIKPFINGDDLNSNRDSSASRFVVNFYDWSEAKAGEFREPFSVVERLVKPERQRRDSSGEFALRNPLPERWWQYADKRPGLYAAIRDLDSVLAIALVSKTVMPLRVPQTQVFSHALGVFAMEDDADLAVLSSALHQTWAIVYGSTLETRVRYTPSDVFETFPRPVPTERMRKAGSSLDSVRRAIMLKRELGLTKLYNLVNDSDIRGDEDVEMLREIHIEIDEGVMEAYGWGDVGLEHGFHTYRQMERFTMSPAARVEVLDRLLEANHRRALAEGKDVPIDCVPGARQDGSDNDSDDLGEVDE